MSNVPTSGTNHLSFDLLAIGFRLQASCTKIIATASMEENASIYKFSERRYTVSHKKKERKQTGN